MKVQDAKILLVGNILNNGYLHARYLRKRGLDAESLNVDYKHCQGQPEWAEVEFDDAVSEENPDWSKIDLRGYRRPAWFYDVWFAELESLARQRRGPTRTAPAAASASPMTTLKERFHKMVAGTRVAPVLAAVRRKRAEARLRSLSAKEAAFVGSFCADFRAAYPGANKPLTPGDVLEWLPRSRGFGAIMRQYDLLHCFALDPIYAMLGAPDKPFVAYEHGTMREFPFEDSARGRLYALALKKASAVLISNADCNRSAERLGLSNYRFIPHIVDDELFRVGESPLRDDLLASSNAQYILVAPARHHWKNFPQGLENSWSKRNDIMIRGLGRLRSNRPDLKFLVVMFEWGREVELSKALIAECGLADRVRWFPICSKPMLKKFYGAADLVLDQFNAGIGTFGAVVPEAFACAKPVMLNYREDLHRWCFPELPPVIAASDEQEVANMLSSLLSQPDRLRDLGQRGREWFLRYHSAGRVIDDLIDVYSRVLT